MSTKFTLTIVAILLLSACHPLKRIEHRKGLTELLQTYTNETQRLKNLQIKNDSILSAGFYSKNYSDSVRMQIKKQLLVNDSSVTAANKLLRTVNFRVAYEEQYYEIRKKVKLMKQQVPANLQQRTTSYAYIEEMMAKSDLEGEKKALTTILNNAAAKTEQAKEKNVAIGNTAGSMLQTGNISKLEGSELDLRLKAYLKDLDSVSNEINILKNRIDQPADFSRNFTNIKSRVLLIDSVVNKKTSYQQYVFRMIEDGFTRSKRTLFNMAAFFGAGGYEIPPSKYELANAYFSPVLDSLQKFSNSYDQIFRKVQIAVIGFADGSKIATGSPLYKKLQSYLKIQNPTREQLNMALSTLRAEEISRFMERMVKERSGNFTDIRKVIFEILESGEGERFPDPTIKDYKTNDERRRIVMVYWTVLPIE